MKRKLLMVLGVSFFICLAGVAGAQTGANAQVRKATQKSPSEQQVLAPAESLSGTIWIVDPAEHLVVVRDNGIPYDFTVTPSTRIESSSGQLSLNQLTSMTSSKITVKFLPERRGDIAQSMMIG